MGLVGRRAWVLAGVIKVMVPALAAASLLACKPQKGSANGKSAGIVGIDCLDLMSGCDGRALSASSKSADVAPVHDYMFTESEVQALTTLVEAYRKPGINAEPFENASKDLGDVRGFLETYLNNALQIAAPIGVVHRVERRVFGDVDVTHRHAPAGRIAGEEALALKRGKAALTAGLGRFRRAASFAAVSPSGVLARTCTALQYQAP